MKSIREEPYMKKFELPALGYAFDALEPVIDAKTMEIHHDKHHAAYVNNLNAALEKHPELEFGCLNCLLTSVNDLPSDIRQAVINNGGGHFNHSFFWKLLAPVDSTQPHGELLAAIEATFTSLDEFKKAFSQAAATRFGSGWAWLVVNQDGKLEVISTPNQDAVIMDGKQPVIGLDVWEHAYYLNYQNRRPDYIAAFFSVLNWDFANEQYLAALEKVSK